MSRLSDMRERFSQTREAYKAAILAEIKTQGLYDCRDMLVDLLADCYLAADTDVENDALEEVYEKLDLPKWNYRKSLLTEEQEKVYEEEQVAADADEQLEQEEDAEAAQE